MSRDTFTPLSQCDNVATHPPPPPPKEEVEGGDEEQSEGKEDEPVFNTLYDIIKEYSDYAAIQVLILHIKHELA